MQEIDKSADGLLYGITSADHWPEAKVVPQADGGGDVAAANVIDQDRRLQDIGHLLLAALSMIAFPL
jgi:hypothetical protein